MKSLTIVFTLCLMILGCERYVEYNWNQVTCQTYIHDDMIVLRFKRGDSHTSTVKDVFTHASRFQRYEIHVLSDEYMLFESVDIGCSMFRQNKDMLEKDFISRSIAFPIDKRNGLFGVYSGIRTDITGKSDKYGSYFNEVTLLRFHDNRLYARKVIKGCFRIGTIDEKWKDFAHFQNRTDEESKGTDL